MGSIFFMRTGEVVESEAGVSHEAFIIANKDKYDFSTALKYGCGYILDALRYQRLWSSDLSQAQIDSVFDFCIGSGLDETWKHFKEMYLEDL